MISGYISNKNADAYVAGGRLQMQWDAKLENFQS